METINYINSLSNNNIFYWIDYSNMGECESNNNLERNI